jgi:hypothetical protein
MHQSKQLLPATKATGLARRTALQLQLALHAYSAMQNTVTFDFGGETHNVTAVVICENSAIRWHPDRVVQGQGQSHCGMFRAPIRRWLVKSLKTEEMWVCMCGGYHTQFSHFQPALQAHLCLKQEDGKASSCGAFNINTPLGRCMHTPSPNASNMQGKSKFPVEL